MKKVILVVATAVWLAGAACSPKATRRPPSEPLDATLSQADALVEQGCYLCLGDAATLYRQLLRVNFRPGLVGERLFRATSLMTIREREVGIVPQAPAGDSDRLRGPDAAGTPPYHEMTLAIPWSRNIGTNRQADATRSGAPPLAAWRAQITPLADAGDPFAAYVLGALTCSFESAAPPAADLHRYSAMNPASLSLAFRVAICRPVDEEALRDIVRREPRFVEADFLLGEMLARRGDVGAAEQHYRRVVERLPRLVAASVALGDLLVAGEEFETALDSFDQALAIVPEHRPALLGRVRCLSNLERHEEALGVCDTILRLGEWYLGPAYYWRAWNLHALHQVPAAWDAIQAAKQYLQTADVFDLSGVIAFDRRDFDQAEADLQEAVRRNTNLCRPRFYLGRVDAERGQWVAGAVSFARAMDCYGAGAGAAALKLDEARTSSLAEPRKARLVERYEKQVAASQHAAALAAYHAAVSYANGDMPTVAIAHAERALSDDQLKTQVRELLARLRKSTDSPR